jgi:hypothetical protein
MPHFCSSCGAQMGEVAFTHPPDTGLVDGHTPQWKQRYQAAILELGPAKSLQRIAEARSAVLDRIEDGFSQPSDGEQLTLRDALETLSTLRQIAEREIGEQKKTGT